MDDIVSRNFSIAKVIAIFVVVTSHWFRGANLWILSTIALFLFGFSSAYFTGLIYGVKVDVRAFWSNKLRRLGVRYWLILSVLAVILTIKGRDLLHWHSIVHYIGLSGVLNLFGPSSSALGNGLWFFTLLLFFYVSYPLLAPRLLASGRTNTMMAVATIGLLVLDHSLKLGFALWLTMLGFIIGIYVGVNRLRLNAKVLNVLLLAIPLALAVANVVLGFRGLNMPLLFAFSLAISLRLTLPSRWLGGLGFLVALEACLLEIYLIHGYFFMRPTGHKVIDFIISLVVIVTAAIVLNRAGNRLIDWIFKKKPAKLATIVAEPEDDEELKGAA